METVVSIIYTSSSSKEHIGDFSLAFIGFDGQYRTVGLKFDIKELWSFSKDTSSVAFDFLVLSMLVYNVDRAINRAKYSIDGWHRTIKMINIPVINLEEMNRGKTLFERAISFLTGDSWRFEFVHSAEYEYHPLNISSYDITDYEEVSLFSGGLDSLIGFIDSAHRIQEGKKVLLVSHMELGKEKKDQVDILNYCSNNHIHDMKYDRLLLNAGLKPKSWNIPSSTESTFRSRSLLFFAAGIYVSFHIGADMKLIVPENGTISINIPLDSGRRSACSTRTTHPTFIKKLQLALSEIGIENMIENPYRLKSKADMMKDAFENDVKKAELIPLVNLSCSCAKRGHNIHWDKSGAEIRENNITHCGMCLPCLYRRVALDAVGLDNTENLGTDVLNGQKYNINDHSQKRAKDFRALLYFLRCRCNAKNIKRELILNGITDVKELNDYVNLALHSYQQVRGWLELNANFRIKQLAGII